VEKYPELCLDSSTKKTGKIDRQKQRGGKNFTHLPREGKKKRGIGGRKALGRSGLRWERLETRRLRG